MAYVKKSDYKMLLNVVYKWSKHVSSFDEDEALLLGDFCTWIDKTAQKDKVIRERCKVNMRKFRSTPDGRERSRKAARESARRIRERKEAK